MRPTYTLIVTAPDGTETRNNPVGSTAQVALALAHLLTPFTLSRREADRMALCASRSMGDGRTYVHPASGYRFRMETAVPTAAELTWRGARPLPHTEVLDDIKHAVRLGHVVRIWDDINKQLQPVTMTLITTQAGGFLALYETQI